MYFILSLIMTTPCAGLIPCRPIPRNASLSKPCRAIAIAAQHGTGFSGSLPEDPELAAYKCTAISMAALIYLMRNETPYEISAVKPSHAPVAVTRAKRVSIDLSREASVIACVAFYTLLSLGSAIDAAKYAQPARKQR